MLRHLDYLRAEDVRGIRIVAFDTAYIPRPLNAQQYIGTNAHSFPRGETSNKRTEEWLVKDQIVAKQGLVVMILETPVKK